jgi:hypothetical protein
LEVRGYPAPASRSAQAEDANLAAELWRVSEASTDVTYEFRSAP